MKMSQREDGVSFEKDFSPKPHKSRDRKRVTIPGVRYCTVYSRYTVGTLGK